jgi:CMP-2-keto-3-deoxyoctulosonic acid synthetase
MYARVRAYGAVRAVMADRTVGSAAAHAVMASVLTESGTDGLAEVTVELALKLASAIERIAGDQGVPAVDLVDVWFVD